MEIKAALSNASSRMHRWLLVCAFLLTASGCASVVYKDSANSFTAAGYAAGKQIEEASKSLDSAQDAIRRTKIADDRTCPIADRRIFVRSGSGDPATIDAALKRFPNQAALAGCQALLSCERSSTKPGSNSTQCRQNCYSSAESNCLTQLERSYAVDLKESASRPAPDTLALQKESSALLALLQKAEYQRATPAENQLASAGVQELSAYLDLLAKVAEDRKSEYPDDAKQLAKRIGNLTKSVSEASGQQLSSASQATQKQIQDALGALGELIGVLDTMSRDQADESKIRQLVAGNSNNVEKLIEALRAAALGDGTLSAATSDQAAYAARKALQARFQNTAEPYERSLLLTERENYLFSNGEALTGAIDAVFDNLSKSHIALVSLVENPTDEQKKALANARLQSFKTVAKALVDVAQTIR